MVNKYILILILILISDFANAEWIKVGTNTSYLGVGVDFYYDNSRIEILKPSVTKNGKTYLRVATLDNYHKPTNYYQLNRMVNSVVEFRLYDCTSTRTRIDNIVLSSGKYDGGDKLADWEVDESRSPWDYPGSLQRNLFLDLKYLCK